MARDKIHNALYFLTGAMAVILVLVIVVGVRINAQSSQNLSETDISSTEATEPEQQEKWQEGIVSYQGKNYQYNNDIRTYLMMGIDINEPVTMAEDYTAGGQSDAMFLLVANTKTKSLTMISINRNTMTDINLCDAEGNDLGTMNAQICLQHAFGDGKRLSCMRSVDVVEQLFGNIPISGYLALNMGGIPKMNDAVGGVNLTVMENISFPEAGVDLRRGEDVQLDGTQAYYYLHGRDVNEYDSATNRLHREEQYIVAFMDRLKNVSLDDSNSVATVYDEIEDYMVSNINFTSLIKELMDYDFSEKRMYSVPGETVMGEEVNGTSYEEFQIDEEAMQALIMYVFYEQVE